nr:extracellular matrix protein 1-like [Nerophis lumbriciformis]
MSSSWLVLHAAVVSLLVLSSSADRDERNMEQREITFDLGPIMQEFAIPEKLDTSRGRDHPSVGSRSEIPMLDYPVQFPLGRPTADNLQAICLNTDLRPRYPDSYFPRSGFGQLRRRANAVNIGESWLSTCCAGNQTWGTEVTLCCATKAWELSLENFCEEDSSVKDRLYHCCKKGGGQRLDCFHNDSPNPSYEPTEALPVVPLPTSIEFNFDKNTCSRSSVTHPSVSEQFGSKKSELIFPPARPSADNVDSLCRNQKLRPLYSVKCLPKNGYELLARQAKIINRIEKGYKHCCKKNQDLLGCTEQKWRDALNRFCSSKKGGKLDYECCVGSTADRLDCFQSSSPDPNYNATSQGGVSPQICQSRKIIKKVMCSSKKTAPPVTRRCCRMAPQEQPKCFTNFVMDAITKATKVSNQRKKRCPL